MKRTAVIIGTLALALQGCAPPMSPIEALRESVHADARKGGELRCDVRLAESKVIHEQCRQEGRMISDCRFHESGLIACEFPELRK